MLEIDHELRQLIPALQREEKELLEKSLIKEGCRDSLIVWNNTIIDGHNRYEICKKHNIQFSIESMDFENISQAKQWMINNQLARRNLTDSQRKYFIGKRYTEDKVVEEFKGNQYTKSGGTQDGNNQRTSEKIAEDYGISKNTVIRNEDYSKAIDEIRKEDTEIADKILTEEVKLNNKEVLELSREEPQQQKKVIELISTGKAKRVDEAKRIIDPQAVKEYEEKDKQIEKEHSNHRLVANLINDVKFLNIDDGAVDDYLNLVAVESFKTDFAKNCDRLIEKLNEMKAYYNSTNKIRRIK